MSVAGCALVVRGTQQSIKVDAVSREGNALEADCRPSGGTLQPAAAAAPAPAHSLTVRRSIDDLLISCTSQGKVVATAKVVSRSDMGLVSLVVGGMISASIDHLSGAAFAYPEWITLVAGEDRVYDRRDSPDGPWTGALLKPIGPPPSVVVRKDRPPAFAFYRADFNVPASHLREPGARPTGRDTYNAEKLAAAMNCSATPRAVLVERGAGFEIHHVACSAAADLLLRCEYGRCREQPPVVLVQAP